MKPLLIVSTGRCVWDDVKKVETADFDVMAVNHMILFWPGHLKWAVSVHEGMLELLIKLRTFRRCRNKPISCSLEEHRCFECDIKTSGMFAIRMGLELGYEEIVVAGVPFDDSGHCYDDVKTSFNIEKTLEAWKEVKEITGDKVKFISGNLVTIFK